MLIIASMVEREAQLDKERPLVAAVIYNRLKDGMTLGIDATIRYYENNWARPLRVSELERDSPYNTRLNRGLPPTPIGNPGLASIKAAANPARKDYLFYVRKPGDSGEHAFSSTDAQFQRDVAKYQASREHESSDHDAAPGRLRMARRPFALARDARGGARGVGLPDWRYLKLPLPPELFAETVRALPAAGFRGVNVTIPHKEAALALADEASDAAREIGAANTLTFERDGAIHAENTDAPGLIAALGETWDPAGRACSCSAPAGPRGPPSGRSCGPARPTWPVWNRTHERAVALAEQLGARAWSGPGRPRSSSTARPSGWRSRRTHPFKALPLQADSLGAGSCVVDMVYRDGGTRLLEAARTRGADVIDGLEILVAQGAASFERWTGRTAPRQAMREAVGAIAST